MNKNNWRWWSHFRIVVCVFLLLNLGGCASTTEMTQEATPQQAVVETVPPQHVHQAELLVADKQAGASCGQCCCASMKDKKSDMKCCKKKKEMNCCGKGKKCCKKKMKCCKMVPQEKKEGKKCNLPDQPGGMMHH